MTALILTTIAIAILSAWYDKVRIAGGHDILHVPRWLIRAALVSIAALLFGHPWMVLGLWGLFSAVFRFALNRWRGKDWRYVSPSNWYDWQFIRHTIAAIPLPQSWREEIESNHGFDYAYSPNYRDEIHRAGTIAYAVEVVAFVVVAYLHLK
jgi:hypothetical protein